jgi:D-alanyl-lipoteichoic acid acyltransferase DltB (MBOAT superfamily)
MRQILWGLFKKIVVADNCAVYVDQVFSTYTEQTGSTLLLGIVFFAFQLYCDFSGYSEIAIGTAKLFGIRLMRNFNNPYFATSFADYWKRNHISLTTWFMDYVYYPLIGSSDKLWYWNLCMIITFLLSGMWHGAGWTFLLWGLYQGIIIVISMNLSKSRKRFEKKHHLKDNKVYEFFTMFVTFFIVCIGLVLFRAESIGQAWEYVCGICNVSILTIPVFKKLAFRLAIFVCTMLIVEWLQRGEEHGLVMEKKGLFKMWYVRWTIYIALTLFCICIALSVGKSNFIYFQF